MYQQILENSAFVSCFSLLAIGYEQFGDLKGGQCQETISKLLVPTKTPAQIYARLKNLRSAKALPNSVKVGC